MKVSALLAAALFAAGTALAKKGHKPCESPENCAEKCSDGAYTRFRNREGVESFACKGSHADYKYVAMGCSQTIDFSNKLTRKHCPSIQGITCDLGPWHKVKCVAEPRWLREFSLICSEGVQRWSAKIMDYDLLNKCPHEQ